MEILEFECRDEAIKWPGLIFSRGKDFDSENKILLRVRFAKNLKFPIKALQEEIEPVVM